MKGNILGFNVYHAPEGCDEEFIGFAADLDEAEKMVGRPGLEKSLWGTARAAGHCAGLHAPGGIEDEDSIKWLVGGDGYYCVVAVIG